MIIIKKAFGKIIYFIGKVIEFILSLMINIMEIVTSLVKGIGRSLLALFSMGGIFFFILIGPRLLFSPSFMLLLVFLFVFPILASRSVSFLKYIRFVSTEYLYDHADYWKLGRKAQFDSFGGYANKYKRKEEERLRREQRARQKAQQEEWERRFKQWQEYQKSHQNYGGGYGHYGGGQNFGGQSYTNPASEFKSIYEKSCDVLGLDYDADKYEIKLAYREKAKKYHPDINRSSDATEVFQEINEAYEFLSDANVDRYKGLVN